MRCLILLLLAVVALFALPLAPLAADPCGMVPPPFEVGQGPPIERIGLQKTYVFHHNGVQTVVLRPGFRGKVDNFGMLIPFPVPPAIRKVDDSIFTQIANAIDPPEVVVDASWYRNDMQFGAMGGATANSAVEHKYDAARDPDFLQVHSEEGVGMYQVAVLSAGSAEALQRWMDDNGYVYPDGMDKPVQDYVEAKWCFVAVKTRVSAKSSVDPQAGQRGIDSSNSFGFDGNVQAMGFRFPAEKLVVPMRLSAFNKGELHNVVYLLTDGPRKIVGIPEEYVRRQVSGSDLYRNLTSPLPLRVLNGTIDDLPQYVVDDLKQQRDAEPHLGIARELFLWDLHAAETGQLMHGHELKEKQLLDISERLNLRGAEIDQLHSDELRAHHMPTRPDDELLKKLQSMTLTIVDGDFEKELLARENLTFASYAMPAETNHPRVYNATAFGPQFSENGTLYQEASPKRAGSQGWVIGVLLLIALLASIASFFLMRGKDTGETNPFRGDAPNQNAGSAS